MITCPRCGHENADDARFCSSCGNSLVTRVSVQERRVVTALFADLARSTSMGEALDPEVMRGIVSRFFELCSREVAARGGSVEKFSGDAVMAIFGVPTAHEDDPERAVRAAVAIREAMLDGAQVRIGIESGEVVVGDPFGGATMATGDAMNVAARLEQQAAPGDIVVGPTVFEQVRDLVDAQPLGDLALRGHDAAVAGWQVRSISGEVGRPRGVPGLEAPLTGRDEELALLLDAAERAKRERKAVLFTIFGVPGVGKSRLTREATARLAADGWRVVRGRCLPYGAGITYWPINEVLRALAAITADDTPEQARGRLREVSPDDDSATKLQTILGGTGDASAQDIAYSFRRLVEHVAATTPLVLIFEDIHWAEPPLLDLIEYLATWTRDAPVLIVCPSRPELVDTRPSWGAGRMEASRISLEPLTEDESRSLLAALLTVEDLPGALRQRVLDRAEGNPLFVEEVVRMLIDSGVVERRDGRWYARAEAADVRVPDSVEALIRARLDTLPSAERVLLQAGSVVGRVFQRSAVAAIASVEQVPRPLEPHLEDAILRDIITDERAPDEPTFRFRHILIRDVCYNTLPKARRAELHRGVAEWLRDWAGPRMDEFVEIEAYHLEQSVRLKMEIGAFVESSVRDAAAAALLASANRAGAREDIRAQSSFAERGLAVEPSAIDVQLELRLHAAESIGRLGEISHANDLADAVERDAAAAGRRDIEGRAIVIKAINGWVSPETADAQRALAELRRARELLNEAKDWRYLTLALEFLGYEGWWYGDMDLAETGWQEMATVAHEHGLVDQEVAAVLHLGQAEAIRDNPEGRRHRLREASELAERGSASRLTHAHVMRQLGTFIGNNDSVEEGRRLLRESAAVLDELGDTEELSTALQFQGDIEFRLGNLELALTLYRQALPLVLEHAGYRPEVERRIAGTLVRLGRVDEAEAIALEAVAHTVPDDWATVASTRSTLGELRAAQGRYDEAEQLLRDGIAVIEDKEFSKSDEYLALAEFLCRTGRPAEAAEWMVKLRESVSSLPAGSPLREYFEAQASAAEAMASNP